MPAQEFESLISRFKEAGYLFSAFQENPPERTIFLRHDVDFSVEAAFDIARREARLGVTATYFFLLTSNFYNLLARQKRELVREIGALGHRISLHFDPTAYEDIDAGFAVEKQLFEQCFDVEIDIVSLHRPQGFLDDNNRKLGGVRHTYEDAFFRRIRYVSDSGGAFRHGHPLETSEFRKRQPLHVLLHPLWWTVEGSSASAKLRAWQSAHHLFIHEETGRNCLAFDRRSAFEATSG
jgi:hypothetical protein